jgi:hypothetical protein
MARGKRYRWVSGAALGAALVVAGTPAGAYAASAQADKWITTSGNVVKLTLIADYNSVNNGMNFNGAAKGTMVVTVPLNDKVVVTFTNKSKSMPHNAAIIPFTKTLPAGEVGTTAFQGSETGGFGGPGAGQGQPPKGTPPAGGPGGGAPPKGTPPAGAGASMPVSSAPQTFSFVANKAGTYLTSARLQDTPGPACGTPSWSQPRPKRPRWPSNSDRLTGGPRGVLPLRRLSQIRTWLQVRVAPMARCSHVSDPRRHIARPDLLHGHAALALEARVGLAEIGV